MLVSIMCIISGDRGKIKDNDSLLSGESLQCGNKITCVKGTFPHEKWYIPHSNNLFSFPFFRTQFILTFPNAILILNAQPDRKSTLNDILIPKLSC